MLIPKVAYDHLQEMWDLSCPNAEATKIQAHFRGRKGRKMANQQRKKAPLTVPPTQRVIIAGV